MLNKTGFVDKGWGAEDIIFSNDLYCLKFMYFNKKDAKFSMHYHKDKVESWLVQAGSFTLETINTDTGITKRTKLETGATYENFPNEPHRLVALEDNSIILEVSTADHSEDNYRVSPGDSQKEKATFSPLDPQERGRIIISGEDKLDISKIVKELDNAPQFWNSFKFRTTEDPTSPHRESSDIFVRYDDISKHNPKDRLDFNKPHDAVWWPVVHAVPSLIPFVTKFSQKVGAKTIGGVWITKVPVGKQIYFHTDGGWHAGAHRKYICLLRGNKDQTFEFDDGTDLRTEPGEVFEFRNEFPHRVVNETQGDRISLIMCFRDYQ